jgi:hypothetical protein
MSRSAAVIGLVMFVALLQNPLAAQAPRTEPTSPGVGVSDDELSVITPPFNSSAAASGKIERPPFLDAPKATKREMSPKDRYRDDSNIRRPQVYFNKKPPSEPAPADNASRFPGQFVLVLLAGALFIVVLGLKGRRSESGV